MVRQGIQFCLCSWTEWKEVPESSVHFGYAGLHLDIAFELDSIGWSKWLALSSFHVEG